MSSDQAAEQAPARERVRSGAPDQLGLLDLESIRAQIEVVSLSVSAWRAQVLYAAVRLGVFESLARGPKTVEELGAELGCPARSLERLLIAAHAMRLLERDGSRYRNGKYTARTLVAGQPAYVGNWVRLTSRWLQTWSTLEDTVRAGRNIEDPALHLGASPEYSRDFIQGMHDYANSRGRDLLSYLDLSGARRLIDVGGGPGTYSILFARKHPELTCTVFDLPEVVKIAAEHIAEAGLQDRVKIMAGDYTVDGLGSGYDLAFLSDVLQQEDAETASMVLEKVFRSLESGGRVAVQAMFLNDDCSGPEWPALHNLLLLLISPRGKVLTMAETSAWLERAGFVEVQRVPMSFYSANSLLVARKP